MFSTINLILIPSEFLGISAIRYLSTRKPLKNRQVRKSLRQSQIIQCGYKSSDHGNLRFPGVIMRLSEGVSRMSLQIFIILRRSNVFWKLKEVSKKGSKNARSYYRFQIVSL